MPHMNKQTFYALPLLFGLAACGGWSPLSEARFAPETYTPRCHENVNEAPSFHALYPQTREIMIRLDPRYRDIFERLPIRFVHEPSSSLAPHASAFYLAQTETAAAVMEVTTAPIAHCTLMRLARESTSQQSPENRPEYIEVARIYLGVLIANEYAHWRQDQAGAFRHLMTTAADTDARCDLYSRMQHVSDIMSMDFVKRGLHDTAFRHARREHEAFRIAGAMIIYNDALFARWYDAVMRRQTAAEAQALLDMAKQRYNTNLSLPLSAFCEPTEGLPWDETLISHAARQATLAPLTYRLRPGVR